MVGSQGNPGMGKPVMMKPALAIGLSLVLGIGVAGSALGQDVRVDPHLHDGNSADSVWHDPVSGWSDAPRDTNQRRAPQTLYIQTTEEFNPDDLGLDDGPAKPKSDKPADAPAAPKSDPAGASGAAAPSGESASPAAPGDETGMIAPEEPMAVPELDNNKLLASLDLKNAEEKLDRYQAEGDERGPIKSRVQVVKQGEREVRHGSYVEFYREGGKFCEGVYVDGHRHGVWKYWYPDGQLAKVGQYDADRAIGMWYYLRPKAVLERVEVYSNGIRDGRWLNFAPDGKTVLAVRRFKDGEPSGKWYAWFTPSYKRFEYDFLEGRQHGLAKAWHTNGKPWFEGNYVQGKRDGEWTEWDPNGIVLKKNVWKDGQQVAAQK